MRYCIQCGAPLQEDALFCPQCGAACAPAPSEPARDARTAEAAPAAETLRLCPRCGERLGAHQARCYRCGEATPVPGDPAPTPWYAQGWLWVSLVCGILVTTLYVGAFAAMVRGIVTDPGFRDEFRDAFYDSYYGHEDFHDDYEWPFN